MNESREEEIKRERKFRTEQRVKKLIERKKVTIEMKEKEIEANTERKMKGKD